ncbi:signal peptidase II [Pelagibacteraceae bacterium]|jgi:signal peptidase II|nr:signal peptidase II [Pelagibacteraceae bacterium]
MSLKKIFQENMPPLVLAFLAFGIDRITKIKILNITKDENYIFINNYLNFDLVWNTGIGFGLFSFNADIAYHLISTLIFCVLILLIFLLLKANKLQKWYFSIILGGAIGNFYDRIAYFAVPDFIDLHYDNFHWFTFNVADIFITIGILLILVSEFKDDKNENF